MYQPSHGKFAVADGASLLARLAAAGPATLVTAGPDGFLVTILPLLYDSSDGEHGTLRGHLARPNPQWRELAPGAEAVAILHGPDAYVTPAWYEEKRRTGKGVPTWNYTTVVAHGRITLHHEPEWLLAHVRALTDRHEAGRDEPWSVDDAPDGYVEGQARGIVGVELRIARLEAKRKLSQNRSEADVAGVIEGLAAGTPQERAVAADMREGGGGEG